MTPFELTKATSALQGEARALGSRSLHLLSAIERAVEGTRIECELISVLVAAGKRLEDHLKRLAHDNSCLGQIDAAGTIGASLRQAANSAAGLRRQYVQARGSTAADDALNDEDGVVEGFEAAAEAAGDLHDTLSDLAELIDNLNAEIEPTIAGPFTDAEALLAALKG